MPELAFLVYEFLWYIIFVFSLKHATKYLGKEKSGVFFIPAIIWGFFLEFATQEIFTRYKYGSGFLIYVMNVPLNISLAWASLLYAGYYISKEKLKIKSIWKISFVSALPLIFLDLLLFEPLAKIFGYWTWTPESVWFGSPIGNLYGWFWVVVLYLTAFQLIDKKKLEWKRSLALNVSVIIISVAILVVLLKIWTIFFGYL